MAQVRDRRGSGGEPRGGPPSKVMPRPRPVTYFSDPARTALSKGLIDGAEELARDVGSVHASQIRRFYSDVTAFGRRLESGKDLPDGAIQAQMGLLKARAAYAYRRVSDSRRQDFPDQLLQFFVDHAAAVKDRKDFEAFRQVFETLIAYHKFHEKKGERS